MRFSSIVTGFSLMLAGFSVVLLHDTTCRFQFSPGYLNSNGRRSLLHRWFELRTSDPAATAAPPITQLEVHKAEITTALELLAISGLQCNVYWNHELWGDPMVWGDSHHTRSEAECCAACHAHRSTAARGGLDKGLNSTTCNTWVFCSDRERCGARYRECWLKHQAVLPPADAVRPTVGPAMWTGGIVYDDDVFAQAYDKYNKLTIHTTIGEIKVTLLPDLAPDTVRELRREVAIVMAERGGSCDGCKLYRAEDFGIQGVILSPGAYIGVPTKGHPGPADPKRKIPPGYVCRAGMAGSLHFFINFFETDWNDAYCWGRVDNLTLSLDISKRPIREKTKPNELSMLKEELHFHMSLSP